MNKRSKPEPLKINKWSQINSRTFTTLTQWWTSEPSVGRSEKPKSGSLDTQQASTSEQEFAHRATLYGTISTAYFPGIYVRVGNKPELFYRTRQLRCLQGMEYPTMRAMWILVLRTSASQISVVGMWIITLVVGLFRAEVPVIFHFPNIKLPVRV